MHNFKWYRKIKPHSSSNVFPLQTQRDFNLHPTNKWRILSSGHEKMSILHQHYWWTMKQKYMRWKFFHHLSGRGHNLRLKSQSSSHFASFSLLCSKNGTLKGMRLILIEKVGRKRRQFSSVSSVTQSCPTVCDHQNCQLFPQPRSGFPSFPRAWNNSETTVFRAERLQSVSDAS